MRKGFLISVLILVMSLIIACKGKDETASQPAAPAVPEKPAIKPGEMVLIPEGEFTFGTNDKDSLTSTPEQKISLPAFYIDKYEVTNGEYLDFCIKASYASEGNYRLFFSAEKVHVPVVNITWNDATAYCTSAGKRLPIEREWEKAARGSDGRRYPWGNKWETNKSNTYETSLRGPAAVGQFDADVSPYGVHDMLGNAQEWMSDWYKPYKGNTKKDDNYGERFRVLRGGRWDVYGSKFALWTRSAALPKALYSYGCRCAKDASADASGRTEKK